MANDRIVPQKDSDFDQYIRNTQTQLAAGTPTGAVRLGLTTDQANQWEVFHDSWVAIYPQYTNTNTRTKTITQDKNQLKKDFTLFAENPLKTIGGSVNLTTADRQIFNLKVRDTTPTKRGAITDIPFGSLKGWGGSIIEIRARRESDATRSSMHPLADAIELKYLIRNLTEAEPPEDGGLTPTPNPDDFKLSSISKKTLWRINLAPKDKGKQIIGFLRWLNISNPENNSGWSEMMLAIIS